MESPLKRMIIRIGGVVVEAELKPTRTAHGLYEALPVEVKVHQWGRSFMATFPV